MPVINPTRGNAGKSTPSAKRRARRKAPAPYKAPVGRSDAAQRTGAAPSPRRYSPNPVIARPMPPQRSDAAQRAGAKPVKTTGRRAALRANRKAATQQRLVARHRLFPTDPVQSMARTERRAIGALSELRAQDPEKYQRNQNSGVRNAIEDVAGTGNRALKSATDYAAKQVDRRTKAQTAGIGGSGGDALGKVTKEALDLVANAPTGAYLAGAAAFESARDTGYGLRKGKRKVVASSRAKKLWKDYKATSAIPAAVSGDWSEAAKRAKNAPVATALELSGFKAGIGRVGGAAARKAPNARVRAVGRTDRPNLRLYSDKELASVKGGPNRKGPEVERTYSRDLINKAVQVAGERRARKGSRVRRRGPNAGTQRRPARDPNVYRPLRPVPAKMLTPGEDRPAPRRALNRRVDTRVFSQQRAVERRVRDAAVRAKRGHGRKLLEDTGRAASVRAEIRGRMDEVTPAERKELRQVLNLSDSKLLDTVEASRAAPRRSPEGDAAATRAIERRVRRGQEVGPETKAAIDAAMLNRIQQDVAHRQTGPEHPLQRPLQSMIDTAQGNVPRVERRAAPNRTNRGHAPLRPDEIESLLASQARRPSDPAPGFEPVTPKADELPQIAARIAGEKASSANQRLLADEFGIGAPVKTRETANRRARRAQEKGADLVPFQRDTNSWTLVPKQVADRFAAHKRVEESSIGPGSPLDRGTSVFKDVVLTSSSPSKWIGGNVADIGMRTILEGITPLDIARGVKGNKVLRKSGLQGEHASASNTGGGLYTAGEALSPRAGKVSKANVPRKLWRGWKQSIYALEHGIETLPQYGRMGKSMRQETGRRVKDDRARGPEKQTLWNNGPLYEAFKPWDPAQQRHVRMADADAQMKTNLKSLLKLHDDQINSYFKGIATDRAKEARLQRQVEDVIGRWGKVSPGMRTALSIAPFAQWLGAAARYVLVTLPANHPIKTALMAGIQEMTLNERKRLGLSYLAPEEKQAPDYQMGMLPLKVGQNKYGPTVEGLRTSRMTSLGTAAEVPWGIPEFIFPQFSGAFNTWRGQSFTGEPLEYPEYYPKDQRGLPISKADRFPIGVGAQLETLLPFASAFRRSILEQGLPAEPYSTILTPATRKKFNYETKQYEDPPRPGIGAGLKEWAGPYVGPPFATLPRIYTKGAGRDIERSQQTTKQLEDWSKRKAKKKDQAAEANPFVSPSSATREKNPFEKQRAKPKEPNPFK